MKTLCTHLIAVYLGAGLFGGLLMQQAIPAMNHIGVAYYAVTWPRQIYCARTVRNCEGIPESVAPYLFTFEDN